MHRSVFCLCVFGIAIVTLGSVRAEDPQPFGAKFPALDGDATGQWWTGKAKGRMNKKPTGEVTDGPRLMVDRDQVIAFAVYAADGGTLKLTAQLYPLLDDESRDVILEFREAADQDWQVAGTEQIVYPGWSAHFRLDDWDHTKNVQYRLRHGADATFEGLIRRDPIDKETIVVGNLSCNSSREPGPRAMIVENLKKQDPDFLFFAGDQSYHHTQHTFGWLEFGLQFRDVLRDRPSVTIPDDHDVGQANIWGENGKLAATPQGPQGGFFYPAKYVNMVQRCQTWHLPDAVDATPIDRGISVYFTRLRVGGIDFAILEDRKFKSGPEGKIPKMGPRPDHINDPAYDRSAIDLPGLKLLGDRQLDFLDQWNADWSGAEMKVVLSQTAFCGAVHLHGSPDNRLLADLDCNGWPQTGRNEALRRIRKSWATHLCGDQHLAVLVQHGIDSPSDGPFAFTSPAIVNTIYGRWWHPEDEQPGSNPVQGGPLDWTGEFEDGLGNMIRMIAYANPEDRKDQTQRADGHGIARFNKSTRKITFECWPRFKDVDSGDQVQYPGWPVTIEMRHNDGRGVVGYLPTLQFEGASSPVVQVTNQETKEVLYTIRVQGDSFRAPVYAAGTYQVSVGQDAPGTKSVGDLKPVSGNGQQSVRVQL